ncbi:wax ester/triacylglycerol synthase domain-containing protein [Conexibacter woesei]|uniref:diacylglycerol O-acyltransferase n=1 Tax=Conexibacter woesei (strain DSM 14684 / CCUG 47730 / CIP 108061 / JCM 11494 / NBRC 100937 / ID131577) TaxID=469383 RepID=D3FEZ7_CONWI|nr:wax ester/triacylglycerol synthase domain-containing protein [Conexibacter woesei]ADB51714.1 protein of unknown function UPF0089 [Conexibacter woesei DSM 14684]
MEQVSPASAALLQLESQAAQMHVGWLARVDAGAGGAAVDVEALRERVERRLVGAPRFRRVVARADAGEGGALVWRDDPSFAVARHVAVSDAAVTGEDELRGVIDRFLSERLARDRPLWRVLVVPRPRGGAAIVGTAHRALLAAHETTTLRELVFDRGPDGAAGAAAGSAAARAGADALALSEFRTAARMEAVTAAQREHGRIGTTLRHAAYTRTEGLLSSAPPSFLNAPPAARRGGAPGGAAAGASTTGLDRPGARTIATARLELGRLRRIAERTETELHDVVLAVAAGALRRVALAAGEQPANLRAMVPVDPAGETLLLGDAPSAVVELPVAERTPLTRLRAIHATMAAVRDPRGGRASGAPRGAGAGGGDTGPDERGARPTLLAGPPDELPSRLALAARLCNLTIPSAHGPERALQLAGAHVRALFPVTPAPDDHGLTLSTLAYGRHLHVTAAADAAAIGGVGRLPVMLADAVEELALSTGASPSRGLPQTAR